MYIKYDVKNYENRALTSIRIPWEKDLGGKDHAYGVRLELDYTD
jgi:hypothetical protein